VLIEYRDVKGCKTGHCARKTFVVRRQQGQSELFRYYWDPATDDYVELVVACEVEDGVNPPSGRVTYINWCGLGAC
jgi:hypothetical protein